ncbi:MAG TPA: hypothetical protein VGZ47_21865 [Gemmataceae bacterium]|jgi:hypothetical protein|nr:hypothetical protein [Gemmataceae bacterium]
MRFICSVGAAVVSLALALNAFAADEKKDSKDSKEGPSASSYYSAGDITVVIAGASNHSVTVKVPGGTKGSGKNAQMMSKDDELSFTSDVAIRQRHLPPKLNEKGQPVSYTSEERQKMKAKDGLYEAGASDLHAGQMVSLHLVKLKGAKGEDANKLYVSKVIIEAQPQNAAGKKPEKNQ